MRKLSFAVLIAALAGCGSDIRVTPPPQPLAQLAPNAQYTVVKLTTLGGSISRGNGINNRGWVGGYSLLPGDTTRHATLWRGGVIYDLGTLGGPNSSVQWPGLNNKGLVVGISQTATPDTLGETWSCSAFIPATGKTCLGFVWDWETRVMTALPTLGGDNSFATSVNNQGQVVGWAETLVRDPTCRGRQVLQFRAVLWEPRKGLKQELPPLPGDSTSAATAINDKGQVVGISGDCDVAVGRFSARHAVLWENGTVTEIGNLGGVAWHTPMDINEAGDVVGFSNPPGDDPGKFVARAFLWTKQGGIQNLGVLPGDSTSQALGINAHRQVVGVSVGPTGARAFLWENGQIFALDSLVGPGFPDRLVSAQHINDAGLITGRVLEASTGRTVPFVAKP